MHILNYAKVLEFRVNFPPTYTTSLHIPTRGLEKAQTIFFWLPDIFWV